MLISIFHSDSGSVVLLFHWNTTLSHTSSKTLIAHSLFSLLWVYTYNLNIFCIFIRCVFLYICFHISSFYLFSSYYIRHVKVCMVIFCVCQWPLHAVLYVCLHTYMQMWLYPSAVICNIMWAYSMCLCALSSCSRFFSSILLFLSLLSFPLHQ